MTARVAGLCFLLTGLSAGEKKQPTSLGGAEPARHLIAVVALARARHLK